MSRPFDSAAGSAPRPIAYGISSCIHVDAIAEVPFDLFGADACARPLRRLGDGRLRSGVVSFPPGFRGDGPKAWRSVVQMFVLGGAIEVDGMRIGQGGFVATARGGPMPHVASVRGAQAIVILDHAMPAGASTGSVTVIPDVFAVEPIVPVIGGRALEGFERRVLWEDAQTGADTRLLRVPAGFEGTGGPGFHPVEEEIFCLAGDIAPDDDTPMHAGSYLWNPRLSVHGFHEHSRGGCVLLEWHDGPWAYHRYQGPSTIT
ncbi:cupin domain-containing protein [Novosphingobium sp. BL-52-GroH]|uniref:cupin domain-containing protein n=1 Tax=Novosphingobium sp. BL-52-GroH TaxID=3349877 RepID=UPI00384C04E6